MADPTEFPGFKQASPRDTARESTFLTATLRFADRDDEIVARVRNISSGGIMVDCPLGSTIGEVVTVEIKNLGRVAGKVAWSVPPRLGISFDHEVDPKAARFKVTSGVADPQYAKIGQPARRPGLAIR